MKDQAESLRKRMNQKEKTHAPKTIAVVSGKGGVGKSNFSLNFAISLSTKGYKVLLFDMDVGMGNIDILLGNSAKHTIVDFFDGKETLQNIVMEGPNNLHYIAGGTGLNRLVKLDDHLLNNFTDQLSQFLDLYDYVIFDMGAGVTEESLHFILSVDEMIVITTPEPTSITDAYAMLKHVYIKNDHIPFLIVVNRVVVEKDGLEAFHRLQSVARRFLGKDLKHLGIIPDDRAIQLAVKNQTPVIFNKKSSAAKAIIKISERYEDQSFMELQSLNTFPFVSKLKRFLFER
ncbi:MinD/ParA family protein [Robertmurraya andreesenii]|uniref:Flagellar biosynthesis protein FlhG n=1 Tax=Anoxybacillus andreesenii TaxID=1325932 RepID=A0ABT9V780_9BACL|nr:MinD/ParA family protein [Robertmurraya andreesenii]MDQ0156796.1 flagellar biosynthesis protein FlhG [Robertmurraya andreesenii]